MGAFGCVEGGNLAVSGGAPVTAVVQGTITDCGRPIANTEIFLHIEQDQPGQARAVDARIGPVTTSRDGSYLVEVAPAFAVPGPASVQLQVTAAGVMREIPAGTLQLRLGQPARDTTRIDLDIGLEREVC
jgi:hypothetical protein